MGQTGSSHASRHSIADSGAVGDGTTLNTANIQSAIDGLSSKGGGTLVVPKGVFLTGAIFLKPGVNLYLQEEAVLKGSTDRKDYPKLITRIEGHSQEFLPALVNADKVDHLRISGPGTLDGSGKPFWEEFWPRIKENPKTRNLDVPRPRLVFIQNSDDVQIRGVTFKDSGFWNLHLYRCTNVLIEKTRFEVPKDKRCPSTDGTDLDSCQNVTVSGCTYNIDDDCVCLKGSKGPIAMDDKESPAVEHIRVVDCTFNRGHGAVTLGSEATFVRDVVVENCTVNGSMSLARLKLRGDTPQQYEDVHYRNITLNSSGGMIVAIQPYSQYFDLQGQTPPHSIVRNVTLSNIKGCFGAFGIVEPNRGQTEISNITLENFDVQLKQDKLKSSGVRDFKITNVNVNGKVYAHP